MWCHGYVRIQIDTPELSLQSSYINGNLCKYLRTINTFWHSGSIWWHTSGSTLAQAMICYLTVFCGFRLRIIAKELLKNLIRNMCSGITPLNYYHISQWIISKWKVILHQLHTCSSEIRFGIMNISIWLYIELCHALVHFGSQLCFTDVILTLFWSISNV